MSGFLWAALLWGLLVAAFVGFCALYAKRTRPVVLPRDPAEVIQLHTRRRTPYSGRHL